MYPAALNRLESLSNELLLDIFEYLDAYNLCQAFYGLNYRINILLQSAHLHMRYDSTKRNKTVWDTLTSFFSPSQTRIISVSDNINVDERLLSSCDQNLRSLLLYVVNYEFIDKICQHYPNVVNQIKCLSLTGKMDNCHQKIRCIIDSLFVDHGHQFVSLVNLSLSSVHRIDKFPIVTVTFSQLRHLSIKNIHWTTDLLQFFQNNTPNLRSLQVFEYYDIWNLTTKFVIEHVYEMHMNYPNSIIALQNILINFPRLNRLHIDCESDRRRLLVIDNQWQQLIEKYLPHLRQLTIDFDQGIDEDILKTFYTNEFWSKKKVKVKTSINKAKSRYRLVKTIYFGKEWHFEYFDNTHS